MIVILHSITNVNVADVEVYCLFGKYKERADCAGNLHTLQYGLHISQVWQYAHYLCKFVLSLSVYHVMLVDFTPDWIFTRYAILCHISPIVPGFLVN